MKKSLLSLFALATTLFMASCSNEELTQAVGTDEAKVSFSVSLESEAGTKSRAISDGKSVDKLYYAVFDENGKLWNVKTTTTTATDAAYGITGLKKATITSGGIIQSEDKKQDVIMMLAKGQTYKIVFWAQNEFEAGKNPYTFSYTEGQGFDISIDYAKMKNNMEDADAFFAIVDYTVSNNANADDTKTVILKRPFAQLNVGVTAKDWAGAVASGFEATQSKVMVEQVANKLNLWTGATSGAQTYVAEFANIPADSEVLKLEDNREFKYIASTYILVNDESAMGDTRSTLAKIEYEFKDAEGQIVEFKDGLTSIPVQRNWRTNFVGQILTGDIKFEVSIDQNYIGDVTNHKNNVATIAAANELFLQGDVTSVTITGTEGGTILLPKTKEAVSIAFTNQIPSTNNIEIGYYTNNPDENPEVVSVTGDFQGSLRIITPNSTVYGKGNFPNAYVETASNTFYIASGSTVGTLTVGKGNVVVEEESTVEKIDNQSGEAIIVTLAEGVQAPETEGNVVFVTNNIEVSDEDGLVAAIANAETGATITLKENISISETLNISKDLIIDGAGHTLTYTGQDRAFQITSGTIVINNLTVNLPENTEEGSRGINLYNGDTNQTLDVTLNNVTVNGYKAYAVNFGGGKDNRLTINNSTLTGYAAINVHVSSENHTIIVNGSTLNGKNHNKNYHFGTVVVDGTNAHSLTIANSIIKTENLEGVTSEYYQVITGVNCAYNVCDGIEVVVRNVFEETKKLYHIGLASAIEVDNAKIKLLADIELENMITIPSGKTVTLDLNGKNITGTDNTSKNYSIFDNRGNFTIKNTATSEGKITLTATTNSGWNRYSAVLANNPGGNLIVEEGVVIEHLGGTDMAYGIDNLTNGKGTYAVTTIDGATIKSPYRAIRQFLNGVEATNELYVKSGIIEGANKSIWMQDPSAKANTGKLVVESAAQLKGDVYLYVTEGSTEWPVEVSIAKTALGESELVTGNVPEGYEVVEAGGAYRILKTTKVDTADALVGALENGNNVKFTTDIKIDPANMSNAYGKTGINIKNGQTIDGGGFTLNIKGAGGTWDSGINTTGGLIKDITVTGSFRGIFINHNSEHSEKVVLENVTIDGTTYTISCDQGMKQNLEAYNSTFNGWTSYAATIGEVSFTNCKFGEGGGYAYCRPYAPTKFIGCEFEAGFEVDTRAAVTFENCKIGGVALTAENLATLVTSNIANATVK